MNRTAKLPYNELQSKKFGRTTDLKLKVVADRSVVCKNSSTIVTVPLGNEIL